MLFFTFTEQSLATFCDFLFLLGKLSIFSHFVCKTILHYELQTTIQTLKLVVTFLGFSWTLLGFIPFPSSHSAIPSFMTHPSAFCSMLLLPAALCSSPSAMKGHILCTGTGIVPPFPSSPL